MVLNQLQPGQHFTLLANNHTKIYKVVSHNREKGWVNAKIVASPPGDGHAWIFYDKPAPSYVPYESANRQVWFSRNPDGSVTFYGV